MDTHQIDAPTTVGARKVDTMRGKNVSSLSAQWANRPDDQRFLSLSDLRNHVSTRADRSAATVADTRQIRVVTDKNRLSHLALEHDGIEIAPTHWSFGQLCSTVKAPPGYLRSLPGPIAAVPLQYQLATYQNEAVKFYVETNGHAELRAVTSPSYGRILDRDVVDQVLRIAPEGSDWKVPGLIDWSTGRYDPNVAHDKRSTTLYASDRDVFIFLCQDTRPIEVGLLSNGEPDYLFPGFIVSNSEVGSAALNIETMWLRAVCQNRNLWGVEGHRKLSIRHTSGAPDRFLEEAHPHLLSFANVTERAVKEKVTSAKLLKLATDEDERIKTLTRLDFSKRKAIEILEQCAEETGTLPESAWDFVQAITAHARDIPNQDARIEVERTAAKLMA